MAAFFYHNTCIYTKWKEDAMSKRKSFENEVVVSEGLDVGDRLIVTGHQMVDAGDRVRDVSEGSGR